MAQATALAREADHVVIVVGLPAQAETEAVDRPDCRLPEGMTTWSRCCST